jgi:hypothetical protein
VGNWKKVITSNEFSDTQVSQLQALVYVSGSVSLTKSTSTFEKGVETDLTFTYSATENNAVFVSATYGPSDDQQNVTSDGISGGSETLSAQTNSVTRVYKVIFTNNGVSGEQSSGNITSTAYIPQYWGVSNSESFDDSTYSNLTTSGLTRIVQNSGKLPYSSNTFYSMNPNDEYIYFISKTSGLSVKDDNGFNHDNGFTETTVSVNLANGSPQTMYQYRSIDKKTFETAIGYELE